MNTRIPVVLHIGADVAKDEVVVACEEEAFEIRVQNEPGVGKLLLKDERIHRRDQDVVMSIHHQSSVWDVL